MLLCFQYEEFDWVQREAPRRTRCDFELWFWDSYPWGTVVHINNCVCTFWPFIHQFHSTTPCSTLIDISSNYSCKYIHAQIHSYTYKSIFIHQSSDFVNIQTSSMMCGTLLRVSYHLTTLDDGRHHSWAASHLRQNTKTLAKQLRALQIYFPIVILFYKI